MLSAQDEAPKSSDTLSENSTELANESESDEEEVKIDKKKTFVRKVMDYEKNSGEILVRLNCVRNPPLNRCPKSVFNSMAKDDCDPDKYKITNISTRGCIKDLKSGDEVCSFADVTCVSKE